MNDTAKTTDTGCNMSEGVSQSLDRESIKQFPALDEPRKIRIKFQKRGSLQYISHLDLQRTMGRVIARVGIPVWYTKGFNPHAKLVFASAVAVGVQSVCEYLDIKLERDMSCEAVCRLLNSGLTDNLRVLEVYTPESDFADIASADYTYEIKTEGACGETAQKIEQTLLTPPLNVVKKTKSGDREIDIAPLISDLRVSYHESARTIKITACLPAGIDGSLSPDFLISTLRERGVILCGNASEEWYTILKTRVNLADGSEFR